MIEKSYISFTLWTKKNLRQSTVVEQLKELMAIRTDLLQPTLIYGGKLTKNRNKPYNTNNIDDINLFIKSLKIKIFFIFV